MISRESLRDLVETVPAHEIGGYEWECYSCHSHFTRADSAPRQCPVCGRLEESDGQLHQYYENGTASSGHGDLVNRSDVLRALGLDPTQGQEGLA